MKYIYSTFLRGIKTETIEIYGDNRFEKYSKIREACRGVIINNGKILLTYEVANDIWSIPGGGKEADESNEICCIRELAEETGFQCKPLQRYLTVNEYYEDYLYSSHYFICEIIGQTRRCPTPHEKEVRLEPRWLFPYEAISIFAKHRDYAFNEEKRGIYLREHTALTAYRKFAPEPFLLA